MAKFWVLGFSCIFSTVLMVTTMSVQSKATKEGRQEYIVYMGSKPEGHYSLTSKHYSMLQDVLQDSLVEDSLVRSYKRSFNGFAAKLTDTERQSLAKMNGVVSVFPSKTLKLHTTRSWDYIGFPENVKRRPTIESNVIIGNIDSGIWPESESFNDKGFGPPPKKWKGVCEGGQNFTCNNKIIGARIYKSSTGDFSARDVAGHGTHTASVAAGNIVRNANFFGLGKGTARGGVPSARIAVYKACDHAGCSETSILAAIDDAIADGVDVISLSVGPDTPVNLMDDVIAIGTFHAMEKGILSVQSAGNAGPNFFTVGSIVPWTITVAASTMDRQIIDKVVLGNEMILNGTSINPFQLNGTNFPLVYGNDASSHCNQSAAQMCSKDCLDSKLVNQKILLCDGYGGIEEAGKAGALGVITQKFMSTDTSFSAPLPAAGLDPEDYKKVLSYFRSTKSPQANILRSEAVVNSNAPVVIDFSSRGPNSKLPEIFKPDISAPGAEILAAFPPGSPPSDYNIDKRSVTYNFMSGTSMACPHVAAAAAYVKTFHPDWSPSAIKSALMTTASPMKKTNDVTGVFAYGSGNLNPVGALHPGLVYETSKEEYLKMLCNMGINGESLKNIAGRNSSCPEDTKDASPRNLNYPIMTALVEHGKSYNFQFKRTVTNVGQANSTYKLKVQENSQFKVTVEPKILSFRSLHEKKSFFVTVSGSKTPVSSLVEWSDGSHLVRSRIVVFSSVRSY